MRSYANIKKKLLFKNNMRLDYVATTVVRVSCQRAPVLYGNEQSQTKMTALHYYESGLLTKTCCRALINVFAIALYLWSNGGENVNDPTRCMKVQRAVQF